MPRRWPLLLLLAVPAVVAVAWLVWHTLSPVGRPCRLDRLDGGPVVVAASADDLAAALDPDPGVRNRPFVEGRFLILPNGTRARVIDRPAAGVLLVELQEALPGCRVYVQEEMVHADR
jgi:hypothetical protein